MLNFRKVHFCSNVGNREVDLYINFDNVTDFLYDSETNKTYVSFIGEEEEREFEGNIFKDIIKEIEDKNKKTLLED